MRKKRKQKQDSPHDSVREQERRKTPDPGRQDDNELVQVITNCMRTECEHQLSANHTGGRGIGAARTPLRKALNSLERTGLLLDTNHLRRNICSQFPHYRLWIREYIVNAFDAQARSCRISGIEDSETITIVVSDDGRGMDRQGVEVFLRKFSSRKNQPETAVGRFGVGSFSVAAIPGQCGFSMLTSTGQETWRMATGSLLGSEPIKVERVTPAPPAGSTFLVTFERNESRLASELHELQQLARQYLYHLPINIYFCFPDEAEGTTSGSPDWIPGNWTQDPDERFSRRFCFTLQEHMFDVVMGVGQARQQLYQRRVLITEDRWRHDLLSQDLSEQKLSLAHLSIRVDSPQFELPLGRHCLSDTEVLKPLARHLREKILPQFMSELVQLYEGSSTGEFLINPSEIEDMLSTWMATNPGDLPERFRCVCLFRTHDGRRISYEELNQATSRHGVVYLEDASSAGLDYGVFDAPVLSVKQPERGLDLIRARLGERLVDLGVADLVQEAPAPARQQLTATEQRFAKALGLSPGVLSADRSNTVPNRVRTSFDGLARGDQFPHLPVKVAAQLRSELQKGCQDLQEVKWEVGHLVQRDGKTPCRTALFLSKGNRLVLNLYHPAILKLAALSEKAPNLAGHFATALCLSSDGRSTILGHLPLERRENLIYLDAICRCRRSVPPMGEQQVTPENTAPSPNHLSMKDFLRHVSEDDFHFGA